MTGKTSLKIYNKIFNYRTMFKMLLGNLARRNFEVKLNNDNFKDNDC